MLAPKLMSSGLVELLRSSVSRKALILLLRRPGMWKGVRVSVKRAKFRTFNVSYTMMEWETSDTPPDREIRIPRGVDRREQNEYDTLLGIAVVVPGSASPIK